MSAAEDYFAPGLTEDGGSDNPTTDDPEDLDSTGTVPMDDREGSAIEQWAEGMRLALGGGLVDPTTGEAAAVDAADNDAGTDPYTDDAPEGVETYDSALTDLFLDGSGEVADQAGDAADDAAEAALPDWVNWLLDNLDLVLLGLAVVAGLFLVRPYAGLANSAT